MTSLIWFIYLDQLGAPVVGEVVVALSSHEWWGDDLYPAESASHPIDN